MGACGGVNEEEGSWGWKYGGAASITRLELMEGRLGVGCPGLQYVPQEGVSA